MQRIRAHGVNVHKDTVSNIELGYRRGSEELLTAWAKALGINPLDVYQPSASQETTSADEAGAA
ncbi:helix-turn-helix transcriptional regulator [Nonomuraea wenchangensis]